MACTPTGAEIKIAFEPAASPHTFDASSERYRINWETLDKKSKWIWNPVLTGDRDVNSADRRTGPSIIQGQISLRLRPAELEDLAPKMLGGAASVVVSPFAGNQFDMTADVPYFGILIDRITQSFQYTDCKVAAWEIHAQASGLQGDNPAPVELILTILGKAVTLGTAFPNEATLPLPTGANLAPYIFEDSALTLFGSARTKEAFILKVDNNLVPEYNGSLTPTDICPNGQRTVQLRTRHPFVSGNLGLIGNGDTAAAGIIDFTSGNLRSQFNIPALQELDVHPNARGPQQIKQFTDLWGATDGVDTAVWFVNDETA